MRSVTWNRFPIKNLWLIPCFFHLWSEVTWTWLDHDDVSIGLYCALPAPQWKANLRSTYVQVMNTWRQWWSLETWPRSWDVSRNPFLVVSVPVSVSKVSSLVSVSKDFGLGLELFVSRHCISYFLWSFAKSSLKKRF